MKYYNFNWYDYVLICTLELGASNYSFSLTIPNLLHNANYRQQYGKQTKKQIIQSNQWIIFNKIGSNYCK